MRVFAVSDVHIDYEANAQWVANLSAADYRDDIVILAGDVTDSASRLRWCFETLASRFSKVLFVPGNHELWVTRDGTNSSTSFDKFRQVCEIADDCAVSMQPFHHEGLSIVPLLGWYDYSFGEPDADLMARWMDYRACRWPPHFTVADVASHFVGLNEAFLDVRNTTVISFSHFLPRIDVMPGYIPPYGKRFYPVLGTTLLERQVRQLQSAIHVYGHSHVNRKVRIDGTTYFNNAFGYPQETWIASKGLKCIHET